MSLTIYTSRQIKGQNPAREAVLNNFVSSYHNTKFNQRNKIFVITPKQDTYQVERELIERVGDGGLFGVRITDFESFILDLVKEEKNGIEFVDMHGRLMLIQKALLDVEDQLSIYKGSIREPNFKDSILNEISELKQAQITPEVISEHLDELGDSLLKSKLTDLGLVLDAFNHNLGENLLDEDDIKTLSIELIADSKFLKDVQLFLLDENALDYNEILFLTLAAQAVKKIEIVINTDPDPTVADMSAFKLSNKVIETFRNLAKEYGTELKVIDLPLKKENHALDYLATELFSYNPKVFFGENNEVQIYQASDLWNEVKQIAQLILKDNNRNIPFSSIAVVSNSPSDYDPIIRRVFSQYDIPYFIDENHQVIDNHFIQTLLAALDSAGSNFTRTDILSYIKSEFSGLTSEQSDLMENYLIEAGIKPYEWKKPFKRIPKVWGREESQLSEEDELVKIQKKILRDLKPFLNLDKTNKVKDYIDLIEKYLDKTKSQDRLIELADQVSEEGQEELSIRYRQIWNILMEILNQLRNALGEEEMEFADFITILKSGIASYEIGVIPEDNEAVIISSLERTILPETDNIYFLGMNEEIIPKRKSEENLLTDYDKQVIGKVFDVSAQILKDRQFHYELEENNLLTLLTKAKNKVFFSYHNYTTSGETTFASRYIDILTRVFPNNLFQEPVKFFDLLTPKRANVILENFVNDNDYIKIKKILEDWFIENKSDDLVNRVLTLPLKPEDNIKGININDLYQFDEGNRVSISRLENFANCPYKHFIDYGIRLQDRQEYEVRSFDTGIIIHEIFNLFLSRLLEEADNDSKVFHEKIKIILEEPNLFEEMFAQTFEYVLENLDEVKRYEHTAASRFLINKVRRACKLALKIILYQLNESGFTPIALEKAFWDQKDNITLQGRIDRIDMKEDEEGNKEIRVIDYKTSNRDIKYIDLLYGRSLQLAIYLLEAIKSNNNVIPKGAYYFVTKQPSIEDISQVETEILSKYRMKGINTDKAEIDQDIISGSSLNSPNKLTEEEMTLLLNHSQDMVSQLTNNLNKGDISINPIYIDGKSKSCQFCVYRDLCRFNPNDPEFDIKILKDIQKEDFFNTITPEEKNE